MTTEEIELLAPVTTPELPEDGTGLLDPLEPIEPEPTPETEEIRRRRWGRRLGLTALGLFVAAVVWVFLSAALLAGGIERIPAAELPSLDSGGPGPVNYLLVGTDSREGLTEDLGNFFGDFQGERADVIMLLHVDGGRLQMVSLPRDLRVAIPGHGSDRINAAYAYGGPDLLVQTVKSVTGLPVHHYLEVRFGDFADVVDSLGGVTIEFPYASRDNKSGLWVEAGSQRLNGTEAVAYVRSRSFEELREGSWVAKDQGDIARTARQQQVIDQLLASATSPTRFFTLPFTARSLGNSLRADEELSTIGLAGFGFSVATASVTETATLPNRNATSNGVAYLEAIEPAAGELLDRFGRAQPLQPAG